MTDLRTLAEELAATHDSTAGDMLEIDKVYAGQIADDTSLYDTETGELSEIGTETIRDAVIAAQPYTQASVLDDLAEAQAEIDKHPEEISRRNTAIRRAMAEGVSVGDIVEITRFSRERIYQIRDGRR